MTTGLIYGNLLKASFNKEVDWNSDDIRIMLLTNSYTPNQDTHDYYDDVVTYEVVGTGYTANGIALTSPTLTYTAGTNTLALDAADVTWSTSTITARYAVIYDRTPASDATRPLIAYIDFGSDKSSSAGDFTIVFDAAGIIGITAA